jgi:hypothetical protein
MQSIRKVVPCVLIALTLSGSAVAAPTGSHDGSPFKSIKKFIVKILDDIRGTLPPG